MSINIIEDGTGKSNKLKVDGSNRAHTFTISEELLNNQLRNGKSYYISAGAVCWYNAGGNSKTEYVFFEFYNNTNGNLMITSPEMWTSPAHYLVCCVYTENTDQYGRFNSWISGTPSLDCCGSNTINENLNGTSTQVLDTRTNGNNATRVAKATDAVAVPGKTSANGYICGFIMGTGKTKMLPEGQNLILGRGQSWLVSFKPIQHGTPTEQIIGCRASVIDLTGVGV